MTVRSGIHGSLFYNGSRIGRCRKLDVNVERSNLRTTKQGDTDETYRAGLRNTTASAELWYDPEDTTAINLLNVIWSDPGSTVPCTLQIDNQYNRQFACDALLTRAGVSMAYGDAHVCDITLQISGKPTGAF